jgi:hypothetical protein
MAMKIFPRNLTARAAHIVRGNPVSSRPESGVDNCFPGLEFDQRTLEHRFFPGYVFEFHRKDGVIATEGRHRGMYLWFVYGRTLVHEPLPALFSFRGHTGYEAWRAVHELLPGRVAIVLGPSDGWSHTLEHEHLEDVRAALEAVYRAKRARDRTRVVREKGRTRYIALAADRAAYVDGEGVIDAAYTPGELTQTMCAPWMYDFRDCYCFYWASSKPDIVRDDPAGPRYVNFMRAVAARTDPPPPDATTAWNVRIGEELTNEDFVAGWWNCLPIVVDDRERESPTPPSRAPASFERSEVIGELTYLATVEHALTVEYLYAMYSIDVRAGRAGSPPADLQAVVNQVFRIAVDEMRHFLWVNMILRILRGGVSVGRAAVISAPPRDGDGRPPRPGQQFRNRPFALAPLDRDTLDWFIDIERPSQLEGTDLDGMYVEILRSVAAQPERFPEAERIVPMLKLIIDEGEGHYRRLLAVKETLAHLQPSTYLRPLTGTPRPEQARDLDLADDYYRVLLEAIAISFGLEDAGADMLVREALHSMRSLDDVAQRLCAGGVGPRFALDVAPVAVPMTMDEALAVLDHRRRRIVAASVSGVPPSPRTLGAFDEMHSLVRRHFLPA